MKSTRMYNSYGIKIKLFTFLAKLALLILLSQTYCKVLIFKYFTQLFPKRSQFSLFPWNSFLINSKFSALRILNQHASIIITPTTILVFLHHLRHPLPIDFYWLVNLSPLTLAIESQWLYEYQSCLRVHWDPQPNWRNNSALHHSDLLP